MRGVGYEGRRQTVLSSWCGPSSPIVEVVGTSCSNFGAKLEGGRREGTYREQLTECELI